MGDNHAAIGRDWSEDVWKNTGNIFIGQAVEAVPSDALIRDRAWQRVSCGYLGLRRWKAVSKHATCGNAG
jgi:hypothetical protein